MKKLIAFGAIAVVVAGTVFADGLKFDTWGRGIWHTAATAKINGENDYITDTTASWGGAGPRTSLRIHGSSENVGYDLDIFGNGTGLSQGDNALIWVKPIEQIKLTLGRMDKNELRGDACFGLWDWDRIGSVGNSKGLGQEGFIFPDMLDVSGASVSVYPVKGLTLGFAVPLSLDSTNTSDIDKTTSTTSTLGQTYANHGKYAAAYAFEKGTFKVGVQAQPKMTDKDGELKDVALLNVALDYNVVDSMYVAVGAEIPTADVYDKSDVKLAKKVNAYARYTMDKVTVHALFGSMIDASDECKNKDGDVEEDGQFGFQVGGGLNYSMENSIGLFADVRYANGIYMAGQSYKGDKKADCVTFGGGVVKGFSNGSIGLGFECATNNYGRYAMEEDDDMAWEIPLKVEFYF